MITRTVELPGDRVEVHADVGPGKIVRAILFIEAPDQDSSPDPDSVCNEEWERLFNEMISLAPLNEHPADVSRESFYMSDEEIRGQSQ